LKYRGVPKLMASKAIQRAILILLKKKRKLVDIDDFQVGETRHFPSQYHERFVEIIACLCANIDECRGVGVDFPRHIAFRANPHAWDIGRNRLDVVFPLFGVLVGEIRRYVEENQHPVGVFIVFFTESPTILFLTGDVPNVEYVRTVICRNRHRSKIGAERRNIARFEEATRHQAIEVARFSGAAIADENNLEARRDFVGARAHVVF
jgi:hypothetical protein